MSPKGRQWRPGGPESGTGTGGERAQRGMQGCVCLCVCVSVCVCTHAHVCAEGVMAAESQALGEQHGRLAQILGRPVGREDESEGPGSPRDPAPQRGRFGWAVVPGFTPQSTQFPAGLGGGEHLSLPCVVFCRSHPYSFQKIRKI